MSSSLNKVFGQALDGALAAAGASAFARVAPGGGPTLRRYFARDGQRQMEITVYRDKWWSAEGGTLHADAYCLADDYQQALGGVAQDWLKPDYAQPLHHFQLVFDDQARRFSMTLGSPADATALADTWQAWLKQEALPWLERLETAEGVLDWLTRRGLHAQRARYLLHQGRPEQAAGAVRDYLRTLPRNIEQPLRQLCGAGLLSEQDEALLLRASLQHEDRYREAVERWLSEG